MTDLTDELKTAFIAAAGWQAEPWRLNAEVADGLVAVLAASIPPGPCASWLQVIAGDGHLWCQLRHGHAGDHESGPTRWKERAPINQAGRS